MPRSTQLPPPSYASITPTPHSQLPAAHLGNTTVFIRGRHFVDQHGRVLNLRGFNVSGASKLPSSSSPSSPISFIDRPFPLSTARFHFSRLLKWGHPYVRLLVTWEALAHRGPHPSQLDEDYISYLYKLLSIAGDVGIKVTVCAHQDVWSRWSGGSGAPRWTFEVAGLDLDNFGPCASAWVGNRSDHLVEDEKIAGAFVWPSGYQKLAAATMATLFWAGDTFAWKKRVQPPTPTPGATSRYTFPTGNDGLISVQQLLQASYLEAYGRLADVLSPLPAVVGFEIQNEPHRGFIELHSWDGWDYNTDLHIGLVPTPRQSLALGAGYKQSIDVWEKSWPFPTRKTGSREIDPKGVCAWSRIDDTMSYSNDAHCLWHSHGVWEWDGARKRANVLKEDYFTNDPRPEEALNEGTLAQTRPWEKVEWYKDCYAPFATRFANRMRRSSPSLHIHFGPIPNEFFPPYLPSSQLSNMKPFQISKLRSTALTQTYASKTDISSTPHARSENAVFSPHFYDLNILFSKYFDMKWKMSVDVQSLSRGGFLPRHVYFGAQGLKQNYTRQIAKLVQYARQSLGEVPMIIGEIGVPFDLHIAGSISSRGSRWEAQEILLDALAVGMEESNLSGWTWWNYNPDNCKEARGDGWNGEDFSVVTKDEGEGDESPSSPALDHELYRGGRALAALIRPYAVKVAGIPISSSFDYKSKVFSFSFSESRSLREIYGGLLGEEKGILPGEWTELFVPHLHYGQEEEELFVEISDGEFQLDLKSQSLYYLPSPTQLTPGTIHTITISSFSLSSSSSSSTSSARSNSGTTNSTSNSSSSRKDPNGELTSSGEEEKLKEVTSSSSSSSSSSTTMTLPLMIIWPMTITMCAIVLMYCTRT